MANGSLSFDILFNDQTGEGLKKLSSSLEGIAKQADAVQQAMTKINAAFKGNNAGGIKEIGDVLSKTSRQFSKLGVDASREAGKAAKAYATSFAKGIATLGNVKIPDTGGLRTVGKQLREFINDLSRGGTNIDSLNALASSMRQMGSSAQGLSSLRGVSTSIKNIGKQGASAVDGVNSFSQSLLGLRDNATGLDAALMKNLATLKAYAKYAKSAADNYIRVAASVDVLSKAGVVSGNGSVKGGGSDSKEDDEERSLRERAGKMKKHYDDLVTKVGLAQQKAEKGRQDALRRGDDMEQAIFAKKLARYKALADAVRRESDVATLSILAGEDYRMRRAYQTNVFGRSMQGIEVNTRDQMLAASRAALLNRVGGGSGDVAGAESRLMRLEVEIARATRRRAEMMQKGNMDAAASYDKLIEKLHQLASVSTQMDSKGKLQMTNARFGKELSVAKSEAAAESSLALARERAARAAEQQRRSTTGLSGALREGANAALANGDATNRQAAAHRNASAALREQNGLFSQLKGQLGMYFNTYAITEFLRTLIVVGGEFEKQHVALQVLMGDIGKANVLYGQMKSLALSSPFTFQELLKDTRQVAAFGIPNEELYDVTRRLADLSAGLGVSMDRLILAYGQVRTATVLRGQEMRQFTEAGVPLPEMLAQIKTSQNKAMGSNEVVTSRDIFGMVSKKEISFEDVDQAIRQLTMEGGRFYQMQENMAETLAGKWARLSDAWGLMVSTISNSDSVIGGFFKTTLDLVVKLLGAFNQFGTGALAMASVMGIGRVGRGFWKSGYVGGIREAYRNAAMSTTVTSPMYRQDNFYTRMRYNQQYNAAFAQKGSATALFSQAANGRMLSNQMMKLNIAEAIQRGRINKRLQEQLVLEKAITREELMQMRAGGGAYGRASRTGGGAMRGLGAGLVQAMGGGFNAALMGGGLLLGLGMQMYENHLEARRREDNLEKSSKERFENLRQFREANPLEFTLEFVDGLGNKHSDPYDASELRALREQGVDVKLNLVGGSSDADIQNMIKAYRENIVENGGSFGEMLSFRQMVSNGNGGVSLQSDGEYLSYLNDLQGAMVQAEAFTQKHAYAIANVMETIDGYFTESAAKNMADYLKLYNERLQGFVNFANRPGVGEKLFESISRRVRESGRDVEAFTRQYNELRKTMSVGDALVKAAPLETVGPKKKIVNFESYTTIEKEVNDSYSTIQSQVNEAAGILNAELAKEGVKIGTAAGDATFWAMIDKMTQDAGMASDVLGEFAMLMAAAMGGDNENIMRQAIQRAVVSDVTLKFNKDQIFAELQKADLGEEYIRAAEQSLRSIQAKNANNDIGKMCAEILAGGLTSDEARIFYANAAASGLTQLQIELYKEMQKVEGSSRVVQIIKTKADIAEMHKAVEELHDETFKRLQALQKSLKITLPVEIGFNMDVKGIDANIAALERERDQITGDDLRAKVRRTTYTAMIELFKSFKSETLFSDKTGLRFNESGSSGKKGGGKKSGSNAADKARQEAEKKARKALEQQRSYLQQYERFRRAYEELEGRYGEVGALQAMENGPYWADWQKLLENVDDLSLTDAVLSYEKLGEAIDLAAKKHTILREEWERYKEEVRARAVDQTSRDETREASRLLAIEKERLNVEKERWELYGKLRGILGDVSGAGIALGLKSGEFSSDERYMSAINGRFEALARRVMSYTEVGNAGYSDVWGMLAQNNETLRKQFGDNIVYHLVGELRGLLSQSLSAASDYAGGFEWSESDFAHRYEELNRGFSDALEGLEAYTQSRIGEVQAEIASKQREQSAIYTRYGVGQRVEGDDAVRAEALQNDIDALNRTLAHLQDGTMFGDLRAIIKSVFDQRSAKIAADEFFYGPSAGGGAVLQGLETLPLDYLRGAYESLRMLLNKFGEAPENADISAQWLDDLNKIGSRMREQNPFAMMFEAVDKSRFLDDVIRNGERDALGRISIGENKYGIAAGKYTLAQLLGLKANAGKDFETGLQNLSNTFKSVVGAAQPLIDIFNRLGLSELGDAAGVVQGGLDGALNGMSAAKGIAELVGGEASKFGPWGAAIGAGVSILSSVIGDGDERRQKQIEELNRRVQKVSNILSVMNTLLGRQLGPITNWSVDDAKFAFGDDYERYLIAYAKEMSGNWVGAMERAGTADFQHDYYAIRTAMVEGMRDVLKDAGKEIDDQTLYRYATLNSGYSSQDAKIGAALAENDYVVQQAALIEGQIADKQRAINKELDKKNTDYASVDSMQNEVKELQLKLRYLREDLAAERWGASMKDYASQFGEALVNAFANGEDAAFAFEDTVGNILRQLTTKMITSQFIETRFEKLKDKWFGADGYFGENSAMGSDLSASEIANIGKDFEGLRGAIGDARKAYEYINDASGGIMDTWNSGSASGSIRGITEETANLLASYVNAIRADVSMLKELGRQEQSEMPVIARAQLQQLGVVAENTERNAQAAEEILAVFQAVTNGTRTVYVE